jgi:hypothetical protein
MNLASGPIFKWEIVRLWSLVWIVAQPIRTGTPGSDLLLGLSRSRARPDRSSRELLI